MELSFIKKTFFRLDKKFINKSLADYFSDDRNNLIKQIKLIFPYLNETELQIFLNYFYKTNIEYDDEIIINVNKDHIANYVQSLSHDKVKNDITRVLYSKNFLNNFSGKLKDIAISTEINTDLFKFINNMPLICYQFDAISNSNIFTNNILFATPYIKYILHQDIHNSIINPILTAILTKNINDLKDKKIIDKRLKNKVYYTVNLNKIKQIYNELNDNGAIEIIYYINSLFCFNSFENSPILININPYLLIKINVEIEKDNLKIRIIF